MMELLLVRSAPKKSELQHTAASAAVLATGNITNKPVSSSSSSIAAVGRSTVTVSEGQALCVKEEGAAAVEVEKEKGGVHLKDSRHKLRDTAHQSRPRKSRRRRRRRRRRTGLSSDSSDEEEEEESSSEGSSGSPVPVEALQLGEDEEEELNRMGSLSVSSGDSSDDAGEDTPHIRTSLPQQSPTSVPSSSPSSSAQGGPSQSRGRRQILLAANFSKMVSATVQSSSETLTSSTTVISESSGLRSHDKSHDLPLESHVRSHDQPLESHDRSHDDLLLAQLYQETEHHAAVHLACAAITRCHLLGGIKIFTDWLQCYPTVIATYAKVPLMSIPN